MLLLLLRRSGRIVRSRGIGVFACNEKRQSVESMCSASAAGGVTTAVSRRRVAAETVGTVTAAVAPRTRTAVVSRHDHGDHDDEYDQYDEHDRGVFPLLIAHFVDR